MEKQAYTTKPAPDMAATLRRRLTIGLPASSRGEERRFPLTPEGVTRLAERGFVIKIEQGAAAALNYPENRYTRQGAFIVSRDEALGCDIVISMAPLRPRDVSNMRRGSLLLTLLHPEMQNADTVAPLLQRHITTLALDLIEDSEGNRPFGDILAEIDGRAAMTVAAMQLADPAGKGILLGGVAGIVACEVVVIGSGIAACSAASAANGLGATVRMFDNDVYRLRRSVSELGQWVVASSLHPHVVGNALRSADVIVAAAPSHDVILGADAVDLMKTGVVIVDLSSMPGASFPSLPAIDVNNRAAIAEARRCSQRVALTNPGSLVPRTAAMAMSDTLLTTLERMFAFRSLSDALNGHCGLRTAVVTYLGRVVNQQIAKAAGMRPVDISIYLSPS